MLSEVILTQYQGSNLGYFIVSSDLPAVFFAKMKASKILSQEVVSIPQAPLDKYIGKDSLGLL